MDGAYGQVQGGLSAAKGLSRQTRVYTSGLGSWRDNADSDTFDQSSITATGGLSHTLAEGSTVALSGQAQRLWLGQEGYRSGYGLIGQATRPLTGGAALSAQLQAFHFDYDGNPSQDADRFGLSVTYAGRIWFAGGSAGEERTANATARHLGYRFASGQTGVEYRLSERVALLAGAAIERRDYASRDPLFLEGRLDTQFDVTAALRYEF